MEREEESRVVAEARKVEEETLAEQARANTRLIDDERLQQISAMGTAAYAEEAMEGVDRVAEAEVLEEEALSEASTSIPGPPSPPAFIGPEPPPQPQTGLFPRISQPPPVKPRLKRLKPREIHEFKEPEPEIDVFTSDLSAILGSVFGKRGKINKKSWLRFLPVLIVVAIFTVVAVSGALNDNKKSTSTSSSKTNVATSIYYVSIDSPGNNTTVAEDTVTVSGKVTDYSQKPVGGASVTISVNSTGTVNCTTGTDGRYSAPVILSEGQNSIKVVAVKVASKGSNSISCYRVDEAQPPAEPVPVNP